MDTWTSDWKLFGDMVQQHLAKSCSPESIAFEVAARQIRWNGILSKKDLDPNAPMIVLEMEPYSLELMNGENTLLPNLVIPLREDAINDWSNVAVGGRVTFSAVFVDKQYFIPPFELTRLSGGRTIVSLCLVEGTLVTHV